MFRSLASSCVYFHLVQKVVGRGLHWLLPSDLQARTHLHTGVSPQLLQLGCGAAPCGVLAVSTGRRTCSYTCESLRL